jgi:hypothetical protein
VECKGKIMKSPQKQIKGRLIAFCNKGVIIQNQGKLLLYDFELNNPARLCTISISFLKQGLINFRLAERVLRTEIRAACVWRDRLYYSNNSALYSYDFNSQEHRIEINFRKGMRAPLSITVIYGIKGFDEQLCFGEYFSNENRESVKIWSLINGKWENVYEFPAKLIRHIHGIQIDQVRDCVYVLTGDNDNESIIWKAENNFKDIHPLIYGDQQSRTCQLCPREKDFIYVTDSEYEGNNIYQVKINDNTYVKEKISSIDGSVIYGFSDCENEELYFSTTVEPNKGGIYTDKVNVYRLSKNNDLELLISDKKDIWSAKYFQYGFATIKKGKNQLYVSFNGTTKFDGKTLLLNLKGH